MLSLKVTSNIVGFQGAVPIDDHWSAKYGNIHPSIIGNYTP